MTEYKKYSEYKDSGEEWLSQVPSQWKVHGISKNAKTFSGSGFPLEYQHIEKESIPFLKVNCLAKADKDGVIRWQYDTISPETAKKLNAKVIPAGSIVIAKVGAALLLGRIRILSKDSCIDNNMIAIVFDDKKTYNRFAYYSLQQIDFNTVVSPGVIPSLNDKALKSFTFAWPSIKTQHKIAEFLDKETAHIDAGISHMESLIALLTEKRAALVSETVTRGIPGEHTEFKDSGVDWLGEIPASWDIAKVRDFFTERREKNDLGQKANYLSLMANRGVIPYAEKGNIGNKMPEDLSNTKKIFRGDFVINSMNYGIGSFGDSSYDGVCSSVYVVLTPQPKVYNKFAYLLLSNMDVAKYAQSFGKGILAHRCAIGWDILRCLGMPLPPEKEQYKIVDFLNTETQKIDKTISSVKSSIKLLKEKRQVLISDVVTGKIDVSNEVN